MRYRLEDIIASKYGKKSRIVARYQERLLEIAKLSMTSKGSFYFSLTSPTSNVIKLGSVVISHGQKQISPKRYEKVMQIKSGVHFSLHPPSATISGLGNTAHIRLNSTFDKKGAICDSVVNNWYPVDTPRNILNFYTTPMNKLIKTNKKSHFIIPVSDKHVGSLYGKVDFYPRNTQTIKRYKNCFSEIHGYCPDYRLLISFFLHKPTEPTLLYPKNANCL